MRALLALALLGLASVADAATMYVTEFKDSPPVTYQAAPLPANVQQTVAISGASASSAAFAYNTILIRVQCDAICNIVVGASPTATTSSLRLTAGQTEYFQVRGLDTLKIAVIAGS